MNIPKQYYIWLGLGFVLLIIFEFYKKEELDWRDTLSTVDEIPYGTKLTYNLVSKSKWKGKLSRINKTFYEYAKEDSSHYSIIYMAPSVIFDEESQNSLLNHVFKGNTVLISSKSISYDLLDTLGVDIEGTYIKNKKPKVLLYNQLSFIDTLDKTRKFDYENYFIKSDSSKNVKHLGVYKGHVNFVAVKYGEGKFLLHLSPLVFTNYYLAHGVSFNYVNNIFAMLPDDKIVWDDYMNNGDLKSRSEMRYVLSSLPMRYAYYLLSVVFVLFFALVWRRKQRVIPVIDAPKNASVDFIQTLTNLYLSNKNNSVIARYLIKNFKISTKQRFMIQWTKSPVQIKHQLLQKTAKTEAQVSKLLKQLDTLKQKNQVSQEELNDLNKTIENFLEN